MRHDLVPDALTSFRLMIVITILRMVPVNDEVKKKMRSETDLRVCIRFEQSMKLCEIRNF